jgi:uroporphyrin-III C-methyltransferase
MGVSHLISIVGAGPGDPELLTVKAHNRIETADVILYDALIGEKMLALAKPDAIKIYVGKKCKDGQNQTERQIEIYQHFLKFSKQNKLVARVKAGDPMIFGRGAEEIRFCKQNHLNYEVIPGITAGIAAASLFDIPLTERGKNRMVLFYTGHMENGTFTDFQSMSRILKSGSPVIIYMGLNNLSELAFALLKEGINTTTPVQIVSRISHGDQQSICSTLCEIPFLLLQKNPETPSIVILGKNCEKI